MSLPTAEANMMHNQYLDKLVSHLSDIGEDVRNARWIMKDGIWLHDNSAVRKKLCDLIVVYEEYAVPVELKGSSDKNKRHKAVEQLQSGCEFIIQELGLQSSYGKFVVYNNGAYVTTRLDLPRSGTIRWSRGCE